MGEPERIIRLRNCSFPDRAVPLHHLPQDRRGLISPADPDHVNGSGWHGSDVDRWIADPVAWRPKHELDAIR